MVWTSGLMLVFDDSMCIYNVVVAGLFVGQIIIQKWQQAGTDTNSEDLVAVSKKTTVELFISKVEPTL